MKLFMLSLVVAAQLPLTVFAQGQPAAVVSPEVGSDRRITFRLSAPNAQKVRVVGGDMLTIPQQGTAAKGADGVWEATVGPVDPGAYRYRFEVDGLQLNDPRNPKTSESNDETWSLAVVTGSERFDTSNVPHGAVAAVTYYSKSLGRQRRMHVYVPRRVLFGGEAVKLLHRPLLVDLISFLHSDSPFFLAQNYPKAITPSGVRVATFYALAGILYFFIDVSTVVVDHVIGHSSLSTVSTVRAFCADAKG
ncbi:MAG TPA: hypothetical protein VN442_13700 [Bryobacteraceae bacterium]|nr:hypothetical protein [Bryobacteraceae bacterium]